MRGQEKLDTSDIAATVEEETMSDDEEMEQETWKGIIIRALKVYLFVMALVFLGEGFYPLIDKYILVLDYRLLYWVNMISAILDNATLAAAEISVEMSILQIEAILMGLIIAGGMLIPGNIPNIISASKLRIGSKEWAKIGVPFGLVVMVIFYLILF
jgi:predicted cation transporter